MLSVLLALLAVVVALPVTGLTAPHQDPDSGDLEVHLTQLTPRVALPGQPVTFTVSIKNTSPATIRGVTLRIATGTRAVRTREEVQRWDSGSGTTDTTRTIVEHPVPGALAPDSTATVAVELPAVPLPSDPYGTTPMELEARTGEQHGVSRTFLPYFRIKEYTPLDIAFAAPVTGDPNPALYATDRTERSAAWNAMLGSGGRLTRLLDGTANAPVTWIVDPAITGASDPLADPPADQAAATTRNNLDEASRLQSALAARVSTPAAQRRVWLLPSSDPDLQALAGSPAGITILQRLAAPGPQQPLNASPRVAWLPEGSTDSERHTIDTAFGQRPPTAYLAPITTLTGPQGVQNSAPHHDGQGRLLLGYDAVLSDRWAALGQQSSTVEGTHRFLADSAALLAQSPSRRRSVLVVAPRTMDTDPDAQAQFFDAIGATPWLNPVSADALRTTQPVNSVATGQGPEPPVWVEPVPGSEASASTPSMPPLTAAALDQITEDHRALSGLVSALAGPDPGVSSLLAGNDALAGTVWRSDPNGWHRLQAAQDTNVEKMTSDVYVKASTVNFFADSGVLQVTVVNDLDQDVHDLTLTLDPEGRASRLHILAQPEPVRITKRSRITVRATMEAITAGTVPMSTRLTTPAGTTLGDDATLRISVQPTNGWAALAIGIAAGLVFLAGLYRTIRGGKPRITSEELQRIDLT